MMRSEGDWLTRGAEQLPVTILTTESVELEKCEAGRLLVVSFCLFVAAMAELACPAIPQRNILAVAAE